MILYLIIFVQNQHFNQCLINGREIAMTCYHSSFIGAGEQINSGLSAESENTKKKMPLYSNEDKL